MHFCEGLGPLQREGRSRLFDWFSLVADGIDFAREDHVECFAAGSESFDDRRQIAEEFDAASEDEFGAVFLKDAGLFQDFVRFDRFDNDVMSKVLLKDRFVGVGDNVDQAAAYFTDLVVADRDSCEDASLFGGTEDQYE